MAVLFVFPGYERLGEGVRKHISVEVGEVTVRHFPDGESFVQIHTDIAHQDVAVLCGLDNPDDKIMALMFFAGLCRELGAKSVGLLAPYLGYMRQDKRFHEGEAVTSGMFARFLSEQVDWLVTIDPHLHRYKSLDQIYSIPTTCLHAVEIIGKWVQDNIDDPLLVGPDEESEQWVVNTADKINIPYLVLKKVRRGDRDVEISVPDMERYKGSTPVLIDDIISTARTMIETVKHLNYVGMKPAICVGVHGIFAGDGYQDLLNSGVNRVVTCNTIFHESNAIGVEGLLAGAYDGFLSK